MEISPLKIYQKLLKHFGKQKWWPATTKFEVIVGAILTQRTSWKNVEKVIQRLKEAKKLNIFSLATEEKRYIEDLIHSAGFYKQKTERLILLSRYILENYEGGLHSFFKKSIKEMRRELLSLKGVGPETADSILLYSAEKLILPIDAYTLRIFTRIRGNVDNYSQMQRYLMDELPEEIEVYKEFHALIVKLGKVFCKKKPVCHLCPLENICKTVKKDH
jgi:endonuclease-3 related protein